MKVNVSRQSSGVFYVDGYEFRSTGSAWPGTEDEVQNILVALGLPMKFLLPFRVLLIQGILDGAPAYLTSAGTIMLGCSPLHTSRSSHEELARQLCHELGHLFDWRYLGNSEWGQAYRALRGRLDPPGLGPGPWEEWPAEDFRLVFGPPEARVAPHKMIAPSRGITEERVAADLPEIRSIMQAAVLARARPPANRRVVLTIGSRFMWVSDGSGSRVVEMDVSSHIAQNRTWLPVRWVAEALGCRVHWHPPDIVVIEEG